VAIVAIIESTRVDKWLWAVRMFATRTASTTACDGGHVRVNSASAKPATKVKVGDIIEAFVGDRRRTLEVVTLLEKRVGAPIAVTCYVDKSPPVVKSDDPFDNLVFVRDRGTGRPTKRDRRDLDKLRS
jgi:ribosome-associated heat shock protein Hsp15